MEITINKHSKIIKFDEMEMPKQKIVLGALQLEKHNPEIDWVKREIMFSRCNCQETRIRSTQLEEREPWEKVKKEIPQELHKYKKVFMQPDKKDELPK